MKKVKWAIAGCLLLSGLIFNSCSKNDRQKETAAAGAAASRKTVVASMTAGELHNFFLREYIAEYGRPATLTGTVTATEFHLILSRLTEIATDNGIFVLDQPQQFTDAVFQRFADQNFFDANGILRDEATLAAIGLTFIQDPVVRNAFAEIDAIDYNDGNYIAKVNARLSLLTNLDAKDQQLVDGFQSVVNASNQFWQNDPVLYPMGGVNNTVMADGRGFKEGFGEAVSGWGYIISAWAFGAYRAAARSLAAIQ